MNFIEDSINKNLAKKIFIILKGRISPKSSLLDYGCGRGFVGQELQQNLELGILGVDVIDVRRVGIPFKQIHSHQRLPFKDRQFDYVLVSFVLHHTDNIEDILRELKRVVRKKIFIFEDTPSNLVTNWQCNLHGFAFKMVYGLKNNWQFYSYDEWQNIFSSVGLKQEKAISFHSNNPIYNPSRTLFIVK